MLTIILASVFDTFYMKIKSSSLSARSTVLHGLEPVTSRRERHHCTAVDTVAKRARYEVDSENFDQP